MALAPSIAAQTDLARRSTPAVLPAPHSSAVSINTESLAVSIEVAAIRSLPSDRARRNRNPLPPRQFMALAFALVAACTPSGDSVQMFESWDELESRAAAIQVGDSRLALENRLGLSCGSNSPVHSNQTYHYYYVDCDLAETGDDESCPRVIVALESDVVADIEVIPLRPIPFDPKDWRESGENRRGCMQTSLLELLRRGKWTKSSVEETLGRPGSEELGTDGTSMWLYSLGTGERGLALCLELIVWFDLDGNVTRVDVGDD